MDCMSVRKLYRPAQITAGIISSVIKKEVHHPSPKNISHCRKKEKIGSEIEYQNQIMFQNTDVNLIYYYTEKKIKPDGKEQTTEFAWITDITITKNNARKIVNAGRNRWKIENQGFNRQKHWQGNIEHACSWNEQAQKNHYLMEQIADFIKQLYEYFYLAKMK